jgi:hypothetical protein
MIKKFTGNAIKVALHSQGIVSNEVVGALIPARQQISRLLLVKEQIFCPKSDNLVKSRYNLCIHNQL